ncbi:YceD family protein [Evansella sp. AB-P1]|uniref:YceD family protein n=1 Tax=Evansella sp. AB-P1 TaxID=3037653 RepID=UPI00241C9B2F|nr:YceD family protein [Evansella sp. AB-P1]MDG5788306.1 YceD family protein [Evansella sp. AB-P1]
MKWLVQQLLTHKENGLHIDESVDVSEVKEVDREIRDISPVQVTGDAFFSSKAVTFQLRISGTMILPCARTLNDVEYPFTIEAIEIFRLNDRGIFEEEEEVHDIENNTINLLPYVKERILLEKPLRVFSDKDESLAPASGKGWELRTKEEEKGKIDPRLKELEKFFDNEK